MKVLLGFVFLLVGIFLFASLYRVLALSRSPVLPNSILQNNSSNQKLFPINIEILSQNLYLPVNNVSVTNGNWEDTKNSVGYVLESPIPGTEGNSIFYAHNRPNLFGKLKYLKKTDKVSVIFSNGTAKDFYVTRVFEVTKDQTHILTKTDNPTITLYTCSGFLDSKRLIVIAEPVL